MITLKEFLIFLSVWFNILAVIYFKNQTEPKKNHSYPKAKEYAGGENLLTRKDMLMDDANLNHRDKR